MGHWARIDNNNIVQEVIVIKEAELDTGNWGDKSKWIKTSYNTFEGKHYTPKDHQDWSEESSDQSKALRFRYAGVGMYYDVTNDVFYEQQPFASWTLDKTTWKWEAPIEEPSLTEEQFKNNKYYIWDEDLHQSDNTKGWVLTK
tara:strand:- start:679 stop:1107 length:429 start_codon:yes stop_codon:yes gene_type:complete